MRDSRTFSSQQPKKVPWKKKKTGNCPRRTPCKLLTAYPFRVQCVMVHVCMYRWPGIPAFPNRRRHLSPLTIPPPAVLRPWSSPPSLRMHRSATTAPFETCNSTQRPRHNVTVGPSEFRREISVGVSANVIIHLFVVNNTSVALCIQHGAGLKKKKNHRCAVLFFFCFVVHAIRKSTGHTILQHT